MSRSGRVSVVVVAGALAFAGLGGAAVAVSEGGGGSAGVEAGSAQGNRTLLISDCQDGKFKPRRVIITCADANFRVRGITWTKWTHGEARGRGTAVINDCEPDCARGTFHRYPIRLRAFRPQLEGGCVPGYVFTRLAWLFPGDRPDGMRARGRIRTVCPPSGP